MGQFYRRRIYNENSNSRCVSGGVCAHELAKFGHQITVIEKRDHVAGNIYTKEIEGIQVHEYGAHIFHTVNSDIWNYVQQFATFNRYTNEVVANYNGKLYNLPFNMNTFYQMWASQHLPKPRLRLQNKEEFSRESSLRILKNKQSH